MADMKSRLLMHLITDTDGNEDIPVASVAAVLLLPDLRAQMPRVRATIGDIPSDADAMHEFRFQRAELARLIPLLRLPMQFSTSHRFTTTAEEAILIVCHRLSYPNRWDDVFMQEFFRRSAAELCDIFLTTIDLLHQQWERLIKFWDDAFQPENARFLAECSARRMGYPGALFLLYIDGSVVYIQRPGGPDGRQRSMYNGHVRQHTMNYLGAITPNGIWAMVRGPFAGTKNDAAIFRDERIEHKLRKRLQAVNAGHAIGDCVCAAADGAFPLSDVVQSRITGISSVAAVAYNHTFSQLRECVEWGFDKLYTIWAHIAFYMKMSTGTSPCGKIVKVAFLLINCHTCLYGSQQSHAFQVDPPLIEEYLR